jgi:tetratricopeptide (TPR) repeat protein
MPRVRLSKPAEVDLEHALRSELPVTFARLADFCRTEGRLDEAERFCKEGIEQFPGYDTGHMVLAEIYRDRQEPEKALVQYHSALRCEPRNLQALRGIADIHWDTGAYTLARSYYKQVVRRDPSCDVALERSRGNAVSECDSNSQGMPGSDPVESQQIPSNELRDSEQDTTKTVTLAKLYLKQGHHELAAQVCVSILDSDPDNFQARTLLDSIESNAEEIST